VAQGQIRTGSSPQAAENFVSCDQTTIVGNGTALDPLRVAQGAGSFLATVSVFAPDGVVGGPVFPTPAAPLDGTLCVVSRAKSNTDGNAQLIGIITALGAETGTEREATVQYSGFVSLPETTWDQVTAHGSGGLIAGETYYLSANGKIDDVPDTASGHYRIAVGIALSTTLMLLATPYLPIQSNP